MIVELENLSKKYGENLILDNITASFDRNKWLRQNHTNALHLRVLAPIKR